MKPKNVFLTHLSYSSIDAYTTCQKSWYYRYVEKVPGPVSPDLVFGTAFHKAVERHIQSGENKTSLHQLWFHCWAETVKENDSIAWDKDESYYEALGASMLIHDESIRAIESIKPLLVHGSKPAIETKVEFEVPGVPIPIIGYIDLIEEDGTPGDFKTSARPWSQRRADKEFQPEFYLAGLEQMGYEVSGKFRYYIFVKDAKKPKIQVLETRRTEVDKEWMFGMVSAAWKSINKGIFTPNHNTWKCSPKWCNYFELCRGKGRKIRRV